MQQTPPEDIKQKICDVRTYLAFTLDPVHVGTGEFQLGRVDNTIVREPGTNLPKIPGSSIAGVARACADLIKRAGNGNGTRSCAGKGGDDGGEHCGESTCPVCMAFGYSKGKENRSFQGLVQFSDARLLFFPVYSLLGPVWLTSPGTLHAAGIEIDPNAMHSNLYDDGMHRVWLCPSLAKGNPGRMNMGWLYLPLLSTPTWEPGTWKWTSLQGQPELKTVRDLAVILPRMAIVDDQLFPIIVEDQLEVRTSVSIDPATGAAAETALFTSEAIPGAAFLTFQVTASDPKFFRNPSARNGAKKEQNGDANKDEAVEHLTRDKLQDSVFEALKLVESLGLGGSNTRGLGRTRITHIVAPAKGGD